MRTGGERMEAEESIKVATMAGVSEAIMVKGALTALSMVLPPMVLRVLYLPPLSTPLIARRTGGGLRRRGGMVRTRGEAPAKQRVAVLNEEGFWRRLKAPRRVALQARRAKLAGKTGAGVGVIGAGVGVLSAAGVIAQRPQPLPHTGPKLVTGRLGRLTPRRGLPGTAACD